MHGNAKAICSFCAVELAPHEKMGGSDVCSQASCRSDAMLRDNQRSRDAQVSSADAIAQDFAATRNSDDVTIRVPFFSRGFGRTEAARTQQFRAYLRGAIREAVQKVPHLGDEELIERGDPELSDHPRLVASCIACNGFCCRMGAKHAFLTPTGLAKEMRRRPSETPAQIYRDYVRRIPSEAYENSCVYQGIEGCVLPRDIRGPACNTFECTERLAVRSALEAESDASVLLVAMDDQAIGRVARTSPESLLEWVPVDD